MKSPILVRSAEEAVANIENFASEVSSSPALQARMGRVRAWYAHRSARGVWLFSSSKFAGYRGNSAAQYLRTYNIKGGAHGAETEATLEEWFDVVPPHTRLWRELFDALSDLLALWNRRPRMEVRISVLKQSAELRSGSLENGFERGNVISRISVDPRICGGRPCIKGTRMRVSDLVDMLAQGVSREEVLGDFPYIADEDISAALAYAARAADHRVIQAA